MIEIDGLSHDFKGDSDELRDEFLKGLGLTVLRIKDIDVKMNMANVLEHIKQVCTTLK